MHLTNVPGLIYLAVCTSLGIVHAGYGGATCTIPEVGNPGATTVCTADSNGFCLIDHFMVTGNGSPGVTSVTYDGVCICYYGYSGPNCATADTTTSNRATALAALTLGGLGAYFISQLGTGSTFPQYATGFPSY